MPGPPALQRSSAFFNAKNLLERQHLADFLRELAELQVGAKGARAWHALSISAEPLLLPECKCTRAVGAHRRATHRARLCPRPSPLPPRCEQGPLAGPSKPPELVKLTTAQSVGDAMRVGRPGPPCCLFCALNRRPRCARAAHLLSQLCARPARLRSDPPLPLPPPPRRRPWRPTTSCLHLFPMPPAGSMWEWWTPQTSWAAWCEVRPGGALVGGEGLQGLAAGAPPRWRAPAAERRAP